LDHLVSKKEALRLAAEAAITVLRVDTIIMAKQAGGPDNSRGPGD
jgi:T-complex protein 1 subunit theta